MDGPRPGQGGRGAAGHCRGEDGSLEPHVEEDEEVEGPGAGWPTGLLAWGLPTIADVLWETCDLALQGGGDPQMVGVWQDGDVQEG